VTRKDYVRIARAINLTVSDCKETGGRDLERDLIIIDRIMNRIGNELLKYNSNFNHPTFREACYKGYL